MDIRRVRPDDWQALRDVRLRALASDPDAFGGTLAEGLARPDEDWQVRAASTETVTFVAEATDGFVGMGSVGPAPDRPGIAAIYGMWVAPETRGQGIGGALMDSLEGWAREAGYGDIGLGVTTTNAAAIRLYEARGYTDIGERFPLRDGSPLVVQIMAKPL
ncbi:MAG TPA: GNAT family N-acetyltransferase [Candidatus Limnocylindrales bacterium]|nr:GNAT family N-acetyltransferase [Candidatus Limnocylindrales bacterium]